MNHLIIANTSRIPVQIICHKEWNLVLLVLISFKIMTPILFCIFPYLFFHRLWFHSFWFQIKPKLTSRQSDSACAVLGCGVVFFLLFLFCHNENYYHYIHWRNGNGKCTNHMQKLLVVSPLQICKRLLFQSLSCHFCKYGLPFVDIDECPQ